MEEHIGRLIIDHVIEKWAVLNMREVHEVREELFGQENHYQLPSDELLYRFAESYEIPANRIVAVFQYEMEHMDEPMPVHFHTYLESLYQWLSDRELWKEIANKYKDNFPVIDETFQYSLETAYSMYWFRQQKLPLDFTIAILMFINVVPYPFVHSYLSSLSLDAHPSLADFRQLLNDYLIILQKEIKQESEPDACKNVR